MPAITANFRALAATERGATALEYALIAAIIGVVIIGAMQGVGTSLLQNFETLVDAASDTPAPMAVVDTHLPRRMKPRTAKPAAPPFPEMDDDESPSFPDTLSPDGTADDEDVARGFAPEGPRPGIEPSGPVLGPGDDGLPVTALATPPGKESSWRPPTHGSRKGGAAAPGARGRSGAGEDRFAASRSAAGDATTGGSGPVPPGRESSGEGAWASREAAPSGQTSATAAETQQAARPWLDHRDHTAIRSALILLLWLGIVICLSHLIWQIATRKAYQKEVEDQLEDWHPASFR